MGKWTACGSGKTAGTASYDAIHLRLHHRSCDQNGLGIDKQKVLHMALSDVRPPRLCLAS